MGNSLLIFNSFIQPLKPVKRQLRSKPGIRVDLYLLQTCSTGSSALPLTQFCEQKLLTSWSGDQPTPRDIDFLSVFFGRRSTKITVKVAHSPFEYYSPKAAPCLMTAGCFVPQAGTLCNIVSHPIYYHAVI